MESVYYEQSRPELLQFLPPNPRHLIDIGCAEGRYGEAVKKLHPNCETWGIEPVAEVAAQAATRNDQVISASLEEADLPNSYFDVVTMNDSLEHMYWPETALALAKRILAPGGMLIVSLPNVRYYLNIRDMVFRNDWEYQDQGILDRTHFRFFTTKSATRMLEANGFSVQKVQGINYNPLKLHYRLLFALAPKFFYWMRFPQFVIVAKPV